jgi:hypothetical protein
MDTFSLPPGRAVLPEDELITRAEFEALRAELSELRAGVAGHREQYVTLDMAASAVAVSKKALEYHLYRRRTMPPPCIPGGRGRPHRWGWSVLRPWLEETYGRSLPEHYCTETFFMGS